MVDASAFCAKHFLFVFFSFSLLFFLSKSKGP